MKNECMEVSREATKAMLEQNETGSSCGSIEYDASRGALLKRYLLFVMLLFPLHQTTTKYLRFACQNPKKNLFLLQLSSILLNLDGTRVRTCNGSIRFVGSDTSLKPQAHVGSMIDIRLEAFEYSCTLQMRPLNYTRGTLQMST